MNLDGFPNIFELQLAYPAAHRPRGIIDEYINLAMPLADAPPHPIDQCGVAEVALHVLQFHTFSFNLGY